MIVVITMDQRRGVSQRLVLMHVHKNNQESGAQDQSFMCPLSYFILQIKCAFQSPKSPFLFSPPPSFSSDLLHLIRFHCCYFLGVRFVAATVFPFGHCAY